MSAPKIPNPWTINTTTGVSGSLDAGLDDIRIKEIGPIALASISTLNSTSTVTSDSKLTSDSKVDLGLDNIKIKELPKIELQFGMKPTRVHFPVNLQFCLSSLGLQLLTFNICGETMVVIEDYVPHKTEICL
jgi:hypothetical protein